MGFVEAADTISGELDLIALEAQRALQDLSDLLVVFDDEHTNGTTGGFHGLYVTGATGESPRPSPSV